MTGTSFIGKSLRRVAVLGAALVVAATGLPAPASAVAPVAVGNYDDSPWFTFEKNYASPLNSTLYAYVSVGGVRYRMLQRAGSGNGTTNQCTSNLGWLPNGIYSNRDDDPRSVFQFFNKTSGSTVVRGWVWNLGDKWCGSKYRTELFIHSQGYSGWTNSNYASAGCIKINQVDRADLAHMFANSWRPEWGFLDVH